MNKQLYHPHDKFFKAIMSHKKEAVDFFKNYLPDDIQKLIDFNTLRIKKDSFIENELKQFYTDILYQVTLKDSCFAYLYLLFEHQSSPDKLIAFRLLRYRVRIWELYLKQNAENVIPPIIPLVLYHGKDKWCINKKFSGLIAGYREEFKPYIPDSTYLLYDCSSYADEEIKGTIKLRIFLHLLKHIFDDDLLSHLKILFPLLKELTMEDRKGLEYIELVLRYIVNASDHVTTNELKELVEEKISKETGGIIMSLASQLVEEGIQKGIQKGREEGIQKGREEGKKEGILEAIKLGLEIKFGIQGLRLLSKIEKEETITKLEMIKEVIKKAHDIKEIEEVI